MRTSIKVNEYTSSAAIDLGTRTGEEDKFWFRSDRFFTSDSKWYFTTRENRNVGPFETREAAKHGLEIFIESICDNKTTFEHAISVATKGDWAVTFYH